MESLRARRYLVFYRYIPFDGNPGYNPEVPEEPVDVPIPHRLFAYSADDAMVQAQLTFLYGKADDSSHKDYDDMGRDYTIIRIEPGDR